MRLQVFVGTTGRKITLECLARLQKFTPVPFELCVWYDTCGRPLDADFYHQLLSFTDDVIISTRNHGNNEEISWALLTLDYDYLLVCGDDCLVTEDYWTKLYSPFNGWTTLGLTGQARSAFDGEVSVSHPTLYPDYVLLFKKEAVESVGSLCPAFKVHGSATVEWAYRAKELGWDYAVSKGIVHLDKHDSSAILAHPQFQQIMDEGQNQLHAAAQRGFRGYPWWTSNLMQKENLVCR